MTVLKPYAKPSKDQIEKMSIEDAKAADDKNRAVYSENKRFFFAAKKVAEELDPTNRQIRQIDMPPPPADITSQVIALQEKQKK
ncbi:MAG: hypothetical protein JNK11_02235 [Alphaproteobacteria bacterium]|nr:hypothetical protein [Alphaproteobacteria bacterium]